MGNRGPVRDGGGRGDPLAAGIDRLLAETGAENGVVLAPAADGWRFLRGRDASGGDLDVPDRLPREACERVLRDRRGFHVLDTASAPEVVEDLRDVTLTLSSFLPLPREGAVVGVAWLRKDVPYGGEFTDAAGALPHLRALAHAVARGDGFGPAGPEGDEHP